MAYDTTLPRHEVEIGKTTTEKELGFADVVAVVGKARYSNPGATVIDSADDVYSILGEPSDDFPASKIVKELFTEREDSVTGDTLRGARSVIYVDIAKDKEAGEAIIHGIDEDDAEFDAFKLKFKTAGQRTGYTIDVQESGTYYDVNIMNGTEIVAGEIYEDVSPAELFNEIKLNSLLFNIELCESVEDPAFIGKLKEEVVVFTDGSDGIIDADIKEAVIEACNLIKYDVFDGFCFGLNLSYTDFYDHAFVRKLIKYFEGKQKLGKFCFAYLPAEVTDKTSVSIKQAIGRIKNMDKVFFRFINTNLNTEEEGRSMFESCAAYCGFVSGTPVYESTGNKVMSDVTSLGVYLEPEQHITLLKNGITTFARREFVGGVHRVVSAVTGSLEFNKDGSQGEMREENVARSIYYAINYFDLTYYVCVTDFERGTQLIKTHIKQKITELKNAGIISDVDFEVVRDKKEPRRVIVKYKRWDVRGIIKVITSEITYNINLV